MAGDGESLGCASHLGCPSIDLTGCVDRVNKKKEKII
jgi:hypothetical protein